jgi:hypothetical protein
MELVALYKRVIGLDIHQAQITACALIEEPDGTTRIEQRQFGGFKRDRRELADWVVCRVSAPCTCALHMQLRMQRCNTHV